MKSFPFAHTVAALLLCGLLSAVAAGGEERDINAVPLDALKAVFDDFIGEGNLRAAEKVVAFMMEKEADDPHTLTARGILAFRKNHPEEAEAAWARLLETASGESEQVDKAVAHGNLGTIHLLRDDLDRAEASFRKSLELSGPQGDPRIRADVFGNLGIVLGRRGDFARAEELHREALELHTQADNKVGMMNDCRNLADIRARRREWKEAAVLLRKAQKIAEEIGNKELASALERDVLVMVWRMQDDHLRQRKR